MQLRLLTGLTSLIALAACQPVARPETAAAGPNHEALALAQGACGGCHSVEPFALSPNPASPEFAAIANRPGLNRETLTVWLRDAHNYPEDMDFTIEAPEIDLLVSHILTLRRAGYHPPIQ